MKQPSPSKYNVHFIGIGGIGMSALARWYLAHNYSVSGSDIERSPITDELKKDGAKVFIGHKSAHISRDTKLVIHSAAVKPDNPELKKSRLLNIPKKTYAEALGDVSKRYKTIAVAGAHGKSTTTAMVSLVLTKAGLDPTVIVGTKLKEFKNSNFRNGKSRCAVIEADEYQSSFLNYSPSAAIITNIDKEHLDFYKNENNIKKAFLAFISNIKMNGILVANRDNKNLYGLKGKIAKIAAAKKIQVYWYDIHDKNLTRAKNKIQKIIRIPGEHNVSNALGVYTLAKQLGVKEQIIIKAVRQYKGAWRRMEYKGQLRIKNLELRIKVYDDYAHHPTEIRATLAGIAQKWPKSGIICVFEPHQAKRLSALFKEFTEAFWGADALVLLPIYKVSGRDEVTHNISSEKLFKAINKRLHSKLEIPSFATASAGRRNSKLREALYLPSSKNLRQTISGLVHNPRFMLYDSWIIVMMGAGGIVNYTECLLK